MLPPVSRFQKRLLSWYDAHRRDLPWRVAPGQSPDPYHVLLSESMLQQTQVATVIPYFHRFLTQFPTLRALADADEQLVLRLWQGLGYYSRARNLHAAARYIVCHLAGRVPADPQSLLALPGVGRYTAGAIASLAFDQPAPILDGNVIRVLCRLDAIATDPRQPATQKLLWQRAEELLPKTRCGDFNSALMELGALICTPRNPTCLLCPVRGHCQAFAAGLQDQLPLRKTRAASPVLHRCTFCIHHAGQWLLEQRPSKGRWPSLWQFPTFPAPASPPTPAFLRQHLPLRIGKLHPLTRLTHALTHRRYEFTVYYASTPHLSPLPPRRWLTLAELDHYPLPRTHLKIAHLLQSLAMADPA